MPLDPRIATDLRRRHDDLLNAGRLPNPDQLRRHYETFRRAFGPELLKGLSGEPLLLKLHERNTRDSLVYWLEFKADEELPGIFGSIAGGSALKFGIYKSRETGEWMSGTAQRQRRLELDEAIALAQRQRDQFALGCEVLEAYAADPERADYAEIQRRMLEVAPDVADSAWGHKYFALLFPALLDDYHVPKYQRFHLVKLLQTPRDARYLNAEPFLQIARELGMWVTNLGTVLNARNGASHRYWRVGTRNGDEPARGEWPPMLDGGFVGIGWTELGDLSDVPASSEGKEAIRAGMEARWSTTPQWTGRNTQQVFNFLHRVQQNDLVLAADGRTILGVGRVTGDYYYETKGPGVFAHRRRVEWLSLDEWVLPTKEGLRTTLHPMRRDVENLIEVERRLLGVEDRPRPSRQTGTRARKATPLPPLRRIPARIDAILKRKGQVILYGPPGTGKTYWALRTARELVARSWWQRSWGDLEPAERRELSERGALQTCCFHPAYGYEEFLEGFRPRAEAGAMVFAREDGVFKRLCDRARADSGHDYVLIIDEINRGDIPRIFGELMTVIERSKRDEEITLPVSGERFSVPKNVMVIGTMNTADRSIALLDAALRRRFGFVELMPDYEVLQGRQVSGVPLSGWLRELNQRVLEHVGRDARNQQIGHAYLMHGDEPIADLDRFAAALHDDIIPLLAEHCYEDFAALSRLLGGELVVAREQRIAHELFDPSRRDDLVQALLRAFESLATEAATTASTETGDEDDEDDNQEDGAT